MITGFQGKFGIDVSKEEENDLEDIVYKFSELKDRMGARRRHLKVQW
jgi:hypothetical protein